MLQFGPVTILINNAGIQSGRGNRLSKAATAGGFKIENMERLLDINVKAQFNTIGSFLPDMVQAKRGHIVTVSSIMGFVGIAGMCESESLIIGKQFLALNISLVLFAADYVASKHALVGLHSSLRQELDTARPTLCSIRTTLVTLGRMHTPLFKDMQYGGLAEFLAPTTDPALVARRIVEEALEKERSLDIYAPFYARFTPMMRCLPSYLQDAAHWMTGANYAMD